jgi:hypothetical protein
LSTAKFDIRIKQRAREQHVLNEIRHHLSLRGPLRVQIVTLRIAEARLLSRDQRTSLIPIGWRDR